MTARHQTVILHGTKGSPVINWFPWLKGELEACGHEVFVPRLPTPEGQDREGWCTALREQAPIFGRNTTLIGHSCGATFLLHILEAVREPVAMTVFVSPVTADVGHPEYDVLNRTFVHHAFDWEKIRRNAGQAHILHGDNDPYVPLAQAEFLARSMGVPVELVTGGGHLNAESGYTAFPRLRNLVCGGSE
ncbi:MAG: alpha/beta hydrolase [Pseudomonadota bacterium]|nr:alpha/beta hydrolase [Pseudomonadota bacterium]